MTDQIDMLFAAANGGPEWEDFVLLHLSIADAYEEAGDLRTARLVRRGVTDRRGRYPQWVSDARFCWRLAPPAEDASGGRWFALPQEVFDLLPGEPTGDGFRYYDSRRQAWEAYSLAVSRLAGSAARAEPGAAPGS